AGRRLEDAVVEALDFGGNVLWSDTITGATNGSVHTFTVSSGSDNTAPVADLADPVSGGTIDVGVLNGRNYLDVTFADGDGSGVDPASIDGDELSLSGAGVGTATLDGTVTLVGGNTYRYGLNPSGEFVTGSVDATFVGGTWQDNAGNAGVSEIETFTVALTPVGVTAVRVRLTDNDYLQLLEVEVFERGTGTALDDSGTARQSSTYNKNTGAEKAIDGDTTSGYPSSLALTRREFGAWWEVDLGGIFDVETIVIYNHSIAGSRLEDAVVEALDIGGDVLWSNTITRATSGSVHTFTVGSGSDNEVPTIAALVDLTIDEDAAEQTVNLTGITDGDSGTQPLRVTASSSTPSLIPEPTVSYTSPNATGSLQFTPVTDQYGTATITVTVEDGGLDNDLNTADDNATFSRTFDVIVTPVGVTAVRVRLTDNDYLQLLEVEVFERGTGTALGDSGTARQSSTYNKNTGAEKAIDG
ncbi:MAG: discoidin domain-containing protein, partial [Fuerstiella sp.]|nr:discoidin domain-containing protein [Fuerstiella sp.]